VCKEHVPNGGDFDDFWDDYCPNCGGEGRLYTSHFMWAAPRDDGPCEECKGTGVAPVPAPCAVKALEVIRDVINKGLTENGSAEHRVKLTDGTWLEGQAATDWRNMLVAFRDIASAALARATPTTSLKGE